MEATKQKLVKRIIWYVALTLIACLVMFAIFYGVMKTDIDSP